MGVIKGYISGSRDHDFWISRQILPAGSDFWTNPTTFYFRGGVSGCGHFSKSLGVETLIFDFLVESRRFLPTGTDFWANPATFQF